MYISGQLNASKPKQCPTNDALTWGGKSGGVTAAAVRSIPARKMHSTITGATHRSSECITRFVCALLFSLTLTLSTKKKKQEGRPRVGVHIVCTKRQYFAQHEVRHLKICAFDFCCVIFGTYIRRTQTGFRGKNVACGKGEKKLILGVGCLLCCLFSVFHLRV